MRKLNILIPIVLLFTMANSGIAQQIPLTSSYNLNYFLINPAAAGEKGNFNLFTHYRNQFAGFQGSPVSMVLSADGMIENKSFGIGGQVFNYSYDVLNKSGFKVAYSYKIKFENDSRLSLGLAGTFSQVSIDFEKFNALDVDEETLLRNRFSNSLFDADFGIFYTIGNLELGLSIPQVMQTSTSFDGTVTNENLNFTNSRQYIPSVSYNWQLNESWSLKPMILSRISSQFKPQVDGILTIGWEDALFLNLGYHSAYAAIVGMGANISDKVVFSYNYGYPLNEISAFSSGSHEITLGLKISGRNKNNSQPDEYEEKYTELKSELIEQEKLNLRQKEEIDKLNRLLGNNKTSDELKAIRENSQKILNGEKKAEVKERNGYIVVLGAFQSLENAISYKQLLQRLGEKEESRVIKLPGTDWHLVYLSAFDGMEKAQISLEELSSKNIAMDPWIYVQEK